MMLLQSTAGGDLVLHQWCFLALLLVWGKLWSAQLHTPFWNYVPPLFAVYSVLCSVCGVHIFARRTGQQPSPEPQLHLPHSAWSLYQLSVVWHDNGHHKGDHQPCLSLLEETSFDPWARVNSIANSLYCISFKFILSSWGKTLCVFY